MLSSSAIIEDNDWDSVRQATSALTRDLERLMLSMGQGGGDFGGATPKSANDQQVAQDGNYGFNAVTMDMLKDLEDRLRAIIAAIPPAPVITYPISIANGGTGQITSSSALAALSGFPVGAYRTMLSGAGTYTVPSGVYTMMVVIVGGGGGGCNGSAASVFGDDMYVAPTAGASPTLPFSLNASCGGSAAGGCGVAMVNTSPGSTFTYSVGGGGAVSAVGGTTTFGTLTAFGGGPGAPPSKATSDVQAGDASFGGTANLGTTQGFTMRGHDGGAGSMTGFTPNSGIPGQGFRINGSDYGGGGLVGFSGAAGTIVIFY